MLAFSWPCRCTLSALRSVQRCVSLVMHPLIGFPCPYTLRALFSLVHCFYAGLVRVRRNPARSGLKGAIVTLFTKLSCAAMDFSRVGVVDEDGAVYCAHVQSRDGKKIRHIRGPSRTLSVEQVDRKGTLTSALFAHRPENSCLRHAPFSATEPGD